MSDLEVNIGKAAHFLERFSSDGVQNHIGGQSVPAADGADASVKNFWERPST